MRDQFYVYIVSNERNTVLYTGFTGNMERRATEHKMKRGSWFTRKYNCTKLVYIEMYMNPDRAIAQEKQIKGYSRKKKDVLIDAEIKKEKISMNSKIWLSSGSLRSMKTLIVRDDATFLV